MKTLIALMALAFTSTLATAADIKRYDLENVTFVIVKGPLVNEDVDKFKSASRDIRAGTVLLDSEGGSLYAGINIGKMIRQQKLATWVSNNQGSCQSACAFAWLAGSPRMMDERAQIGFHSAYMMEDGKPVVTGFANALIGAYLRDLGLTDTAIIYVTEAKPEAMRWLSRSDAIAIGLDVLFIEDVKNSGDAQPRNVPIPESAPRTDNGLPFPWTRKTARVLQ